MIHKLLRNFLENLRSIDQVYDSAIYGASHKEARIIKLQAKFGLKRAQNKLTENEYIKVVKEIEAIDDIDDIEKQEPIQLEFDLKAIVLLRKVINYELLMVKKIPSLSREQAIISFMLIFEGYINDLLGYIFGINTDILKSNKTTLNDEKLIDSLKKGNTLEKLKEVKIKELMFTSVDNWLKYFNKNIGFNIEIPNDIIEMSLVRNCLIHNNGLVDDKLEKRINKRRYNYEKKINVTENDYSRYKNCVENLAKNLDSECFKKFNE